MLHTADGGRAGRSRTPSGDHREGGADTVYLFAVHALDNDHAGGRDRLRADIDDGRRQDLALAKVPMEFEISGGQTLAAADRSYTKCSSSTRARRLVGRRQDHATSDAATWKDRSARDGGRHLDLLDLPTLFGPTWGRQEAGVGLEGGSRDQGRRRAAGLDEAKVACAVDRCSGPPCPRLGGTAGAAGR